MKILAISYNPMPNQSNSYTHPFLYGAVKFACANSSSHEGVQGRRVQITAVQTLALDGDAWSASRYGRFNPEERVSVSVCAW